MITGNVGLSESEFPEFKNFQIQKYRTAITKKLSTRYFQKHLVCLHCGRIAGLPVLI